VIESLIIVRYRYAITYLLMISIINAWMSPSFCDVAVSCKSMHDLRGFNGDQVDHVLDDSSWYSTQPYHTCTLPYGHADTARANVRVPAYTAGARQHVDQRSAYASPTENQLNQRSKTKSPPR